jgi:hypothetical protein
MAMMETKKTYTQEELDQERREIEAEFEGGEEIEIIVDPDVKITFLTAEESRRVEAGEDVNAVLAERG